MKTEQLSIEQLKKSDSIDDMLTIKRSENISEEEVNVTAEVLQKELADVEMNRNIYICKLNNIPVAMCELLFDKADNDPELADGHDICHVHGLHVHVDYQRKGIGKYFMGFIETESKRMNQKVITLGVDNNNTGAIQLYENLQYKILKITPGRTPDEQCIYMYKELE